MLTSSPPKRASSSSNIEENNHGEENDALPPAPAPASPTAAAPPPSPPDIIVDGIEFYRKDNPDGTVDLIPISDNVESSIIEEKCCFIFTSDRGVERRSSAEVRNKFFPAPAAVLPFANA